MTRGQIGYTPNRHDINRTCKPLTVFCPHSNLFRHGLHAYTSHCAIADDVMPTNDFKNRRLFLLLPEVME